MKGLDPKDCPFCQIQNNKDLDYLIYTDDVCFIIPDKHPIRRGHLLLIPKVHQGDFYQLSSSTYVHLFEVAKKFSEILKKKYNPIRVGLGVFGFDVDHTHIHLVPMFDRDDIIPGYVMTGNRLTSDESEMKEIRDEILE